ncbi:MAG: TIGR04219 family outer membrane beta-barrel protein [Verrucomicrobia bacterium]|nr:TIGR04219 family outer membrane beta-barrel protein [Deltaproteobacteria bacterium]
MKRLKLWIAGGLLTLALAPGAASAAGIELSVGVWNQSPDGDISYKAISALDNLSIKDDLKYSDETRIFGRVKIDTPLFFPNFHLMATPLNFSETGIKNTSFNIPFQFGNVRIDANVPFTSELKLDHYDIGLSYGVPVLKTATAGILNVDLGLDARFIDFKARITGRNTDTGLIVTESKAVIIPLPMLYLGFQVKPVKWIAAEGEARAVAYGGNHYYDLIGRVKIKPFGPVFAAAGYRYEKVKIDRDDVKAKASFGGPFGEIGVEF